MKKNKDILIAEVVEKWTDPNTQFAVKQFLVRIVNFFQDNPRFKDTSLPTIHSVKYRLKDPAHLRDKLIRKWTVDNPITTENMFKKVTDFAGVRVLHLHQEQFPCIHKEIMKQVSNKEWYLAEKPVAYTWDPDTTDFFYKLGIGCEVKESHYTSIHYLLSPQKTSDIICELQVRTLFEEIWGEIDHAINYPHPIQSEACREQIRVLGKFVGTGTRLVDSILKSKVEFDNCIKNHL